MENKLKSSLSVVNKYEAFYTGGTIQFSSTAAEIFCQCGSQVKIVDLKLGRVTQTLGEEEESAISCFALSPDDEVLIVASQGLLKQWQWKLAQTLHTWKSMSNGPVSCMTFDPSSTLLACGSTDSSIKVYDVIRHHYTHSLRGHEGVVSVVAFQTRDTHIFLYTAAEDKCIKVWNLHTSQCTATLDLHYGVVTSLQFSADGRTMYSSGRDGIVAVWNVAENKRIKMFPVFEAVSSCVLLEADMVPIDVRKEGGPVIVTVGNKGVMRLWSIDKGQCIKTVDVHGIQSLSSSNLESKVSNDGDAGQESVDDERRAVHSALLCTPLRAVVVTTAERDIVQYSVDTLSLTRQLIGHHDEVLDLRFCGTNDSSVAVATNSKSIKVHDVATWSCQLLHGHTDTVLCLDVHTNGHLLASASKDSSIRVWAAADNGKLTCVGLGQGHTEAVSTIAFSRLDTSFVASGSQDLTIKLWSLGDLDTKIKSGEVRLKARVTEKAHDKTVNSIAVSPNDKLLATGSQDKTAKVWSTAGLSLLGVCKGHTKGIWCVLFSPVDQVLATGSADSTIRLWALSDFSCVKTFEGHEASVLRVHFLSRGMQLLSSGSDGLVKLWTVKSNECVKTFDEHSDKVWALAVSRDEQLVFSGAGDSRIILWRDVSEEEAAVERQKQDKLILQEQQLSNLLQQRNYIKAIRLAITLDRPHRILTMFKELMAETGGREQLKQTLTSLRDDQKEALLRYSVEWNTNSKHCHVCQFIVSTLLSTLTTDHLLTFTSIRSNVEALLPYTQRHMDRMNRLLQQSMFVEYTWSCMRPATGAVSSLVPADKGTSFTVDRQPEVTEDSESDAMTVDSGVSDQSDEIDDTHPPPKKMKNLSKKSKVTPKVKSTVQKSTSNTGKRK